VACDLFAHEIQGTPSSEHILLDKELRDNAQVRTEGRVQFQYATAAAEKSGVWSTQTTTTCS
jgi:hypothetical protein